jgi:hypothetical protein
MLLAVRIPLISDHDRFVARLFRVQVNETAAASWAPAARPAESAIKTRANLLLWRATELPAPPPAVALSVPATRQVRKGFTT